MGSVSARCHRGFYERVVIDATTLPSFEAGATIEAGQHFIVRGRHFELWPEQIVLGYDSTGLLTEEVAVKMFRLVSKTPTELDFVAQATNLYGGAHEWKYFASPFAAPRALLEYQTM